VLKTHIDVLEVIDEVEQRSLALNDLQAGVREQAPRRAPCVIL
jgi:hypothetical protein